MKFKINKSILSQILDCVNLINKTELNIKIKENEWYIQVANNPIYTSIINIIIPKQTFEEYEFTDLQNITINYSNFLKIIKKLDEILFIDITEYEFKITGISSLVISTLDINFEFIDLDLVYTNNFDLNLKNFSEILSIVDKISNKININLSITDKKLTISSQNN